MSKKALVVLYEGAEEMEFTIPVDVMVRGGIEVTTAGLSGAGAVKCSRGVVITPEKSLADAVKAGPYDAIVLPGGPGHKLLGESSEVGKLLQEQEKAGRVCAAICAGPTAFISHEIAKGKNVTSHPGVKDRFAADVYKYSEDRVVVDGNIVTSRGPGTAFEFALQLVEILVGKEKRDSLVPAMVLKE